MISGGLNSIIWLLVLVAIVAVVVAVVRRSASAPRTREERVVQQPVVQQPVAQQPVATSGLAPGWYPDQNDPNFMRYFDGRVWTAQTEPRR